MQLGDGGVMRAVRRALTLIVVAAAACSSGSGAAARPDDALVVAENAGAVLAVVSVTPGDVGTNDVRVDLFASSDRIARRARVALLAGGHEVAAAGLAPGLQLPFTSPGSLRGALAVPSAGSYELTVDVEGQTSGAIAVELPAARGSADVLAGVDRAMNALTSYSERQTLSSGPTYEFRYQYRAPDRMRYTLLSETAAPREAILIGDRRWDRELGGHQEGWVASQGGAPIVVPSFAYTAGSHNVRIIGYERTGGAELEVVGFVDEGFGVPAHYRLWVDAKTHRIERYAMMAFGHFMRGTYADFDAPVQISAP